MADDDGRVVSLVTGADGQTVGGGPSAGLLLRLLKPLLVKLLLL